VGVDVVVPAAEKTRVCSIDEAFEFLGLCIERRRKREAMMPDGLTEYGAGTRPAPDLLAHLQQARPPLAGNSHRLSSSWRAHSSVRSIP
jgi:hypothetical protein